jgi:5-histidylcysteine sulfoxide synthase/putative 4-mercaptohistidine N1-methyltranferase
MRNTFPSTMPTKTPRPLSSSQTLSLDAVAGAQPDGTLCAIAQVRLDASREEIFAYFENGWALTELLFSGLASDEAYYERPPHQLRHPLVFYYAHPAALYVNKLRVAGLLDSAVNAEFESLFESGVDEMRWDNLHTDKSNVWPALDVVRAYRKQVFDLVREMIFNHPLLDTARLPVTQASPMWALFMGFEHERIHFETSSVLMRELPIDRVRHPKQWPAIAVRGPAAASSMLSVPTCDVVLGKAAADLTYGWDNEYGAETRRVSSFTASATLTSNADYLAFVQAGGYQTDRYWSREGLAWRKFGNTKKPTFWVSRGPDGSHQYALRTIFSEIELPLDWPVCVNHYEAKAYCAWRTEVEQCDSPYRLTTEGEHNAIRAGAENFESGSMLSGSEYGVRARTATDRGFHDVFGNVWQWTEDHFHPLPGAQPHRYYADFSTPCYDGEHYMMLGGSFVSAGDETNRSARFHFRPHFFQHAGFRIARSVEGNPTGSPKRLSTNGAGLYETDEVLNRYLMMHFGTEAEMHDTAVTGSFKLPEVVHLPKICAELIVEYSAGRESALDLGCAVGRSTFELGRDFKKVLGIDYSHEFIDAAIKLQHRGKLSYYRKDSGSAGVQLTARIDAGIDRSRIRFAQGDACNLPAELEGFDAVLLANVLCRLPEPLACLQRLQGARGLVKPGGVLVMTTPMSWLADYTSPTRWLNGLDAIHAELTDFELLHQRELPFMIREHRRKYEYIVTQATVWRRKAQ